MRLQAREAASECVMFLPGCPFFCRTFSLTNFVHPTSSSKNYRIHCALLATAIPHVADITSIREGAGEQAFCGCCWPSMASGCRETSPRRRTGKEVPLGTKPAEYAAFLLQLHPKTATDEFICTEALCRRQETCSRRRQAGCHPGFRDQHFPVNSAAPSARDYRFRSHLSRAGSPDTPPPPPPPPPSTTTASSSTVAAPSSPSPKPRKSFFRRLRNYVLTLTLLGALAFGGGVWYSRINDNFHDFFTEYVPYGEQAVLYLEEIDFRKRFPKVANRVTGRTRETGEQVKIPAQSGASWRVADGGEPAGRQSSALPKGAAPKKAEPESVVVAKKETAQLPKTESKPKAETKKAVQAAAEKVAEKAAPAAPAAAPVTAPAPAPAFKAPEVNEPSRWPPASPIDPLAINGAKEPLVQDLVRMLNDIITVINADGANEKYGQTIGKAKNELSKVANKLDAIKKAVEKDAAKQVTARVDAFDKAANDLISRVEGAMANQEVEWRKEFEEETKKLKESYDEKVNVILQRERQINEERVSNKLLEQALELQRHFAQGIEGSCREGT